MTRDRWTPPVTDSGEPTVQLITASGAQHRVLMLARDPAGVRVREWRAGEWARGPEERVVSAQSLLAQLDEVVRNRQRVEPDVAYVREWLGGARR